MRTEETAGSGVECDQGGHDTRGGIVAAGRREAIGDRGRLDGLRAPQRWKTRMDEGRRAVFRGVGEE